MSYFHRYAGRKHGGWEGLLRAAEGRASFGVPQIEWHKHLELPAIGSKKASSTKAIGKRERSYTQTQTSKRRKKSKENRAEMAGVYRGKFKKAKTFVPSMASKHGASQMCEMGGEESSADCLYIGHGTMVNTLNLQVARAIVRRLLLQLRECPRAWAEKLVPYETTSYNALTVTMYYVDGENGIPTPFTSAFLSTDTMDTIAAWVNLQFFSFTEETHVKSIKAYLWNNPAAPVVNNFPDAYLNVEDLRVHMRVVSKMAMQNRTLGGLVTDTSTDDITRNPLEGKAYCGNGNGTRLHFKDNTATTVDFFANLSNGGIYADPASGSVTAAMATVLRRPPTANAFVGVKGSSRVRLDPGVIKRSVWAWDRTVSFSKYLMIMQNRFRLPSEAKTEVGVGKFEFIGFEKLVRTAVGSQPITVGYEINQVVSAYTTLVRRGMPQDQCVLTP